MQMQMCLQQGARLQHIVRRQSMGRLTVSTAGWHGRCILTRLLPSSGSAINAYAGNTIKDTNGDRQPAVDQRFDHDLHYTLWEQALSGGHCQLVCLLAVRSSRCQLWATGKRQQLPSYLTGYCLALWSDHKQSSPRMSHLWHCHRLQWHVQHLSVLRLDWKIRIVLQVNHRQPSVRGGSCATGMTEPPEPDTAYDDATLPGLWRQQSTRRQ